MANNTTFDAIFDILLRAARRGEPTAVAICTVIEASKTAVRAEYDAVRREAKTAFMVDEKGLLDRHKCAAALMIALMKSMNTRTLDENPSVGKLIKEQIALAAGLSVVVSMVKDDGENPQNARIIDFWNKNNNAIRYPQTLNGGKRYVVNWLTELYHARRSGRLFILAIAHELFWLETYNRILADSEK